jgi:hypothetical protein
VNAQVKRVVYNERGRGSASVEAACKNFSERSLWGRLPGVAGEDEDEIFRTYQSLAKFRRRQITVVDVSVGQATTIAPSSSNCSTETCGMVAVRFTFER